MENHPSQNWKSNFFVTMLTMKKFPKVRDKKFLKFSIIIFQKATKKLPKFKITMFTKVDDKKVPKISETKSPPKLIIKSS
jgi:hypothetical protein